MSANPPPSGIFHSYPQKYAKTRQKAVQALNAIHTLTKKGPRTLVGTVVDASYHAGQGYVSVTTEMGVVKVFGAPYGSLLPQMRILCRQMNAVNSVQSFVFDGFAPNLSKLGMTSGSLCMTQPSPGVASTPAFSGATAIGTPTQAGPGGYYWSFFFYIPQLPPSTVTLWAMNYSSNTTTYLACEYLPNGNLQLRSSDGHGYISTQEVVPHHIHYVKIQPNLTGSEFLVDTFANYTGIVTSSDDPTFVASNFNYTLSLLADYNGLQVAPIGTWISKWEFGTSMALGVPVALQNIIPTSNSELPVSQGIGAISYYQLLCGSDAGGSTLTDTGITVGTGTGGTTAVDLRFASVLATGPY